MTTAIRTSIRGSVPFTTPWLEEALEREPLRHWKALLAELGEDPGGILRLAEVLRKDRERGGERSSGKYYGTGPFLRMYLIAEGLVPPAFFEPEPPAPEPYEEATIP